jgi:hypothetical protein
MLTEHARASAPPGVVPRGSSRFDWIMTGLTAVFLGGVFLDGWAHTHGRVDETFFTPWHAVLYSAYLVNAAVLCGVAAHGIRRGRPWRRALPSGYGLALVGVALWMVGGPFDAAWHEVFGFEADVEALMSPAHAILALGFALMASGPLRAGLRRPAGRWRDELPLVLATTFVVSVLTFFTQIAHPLANLWAARGRALMHANAELGIVGMLLTTAIVLAPPLFLLRHGRCPAGGFAILITINSLAMGVLYDGGPYPWGAVAALIVAGVAVEIVRLALRPGIARPAAFRTFAFTAAALPSGAYFAAVAIEDGLAWSPHLWLGTIVFVGVVGWMLSYLLLPPRLAPWESA